MPFGGLYLFRFISKGGEMRSAALFVFAFVITPLEIAAETSVAPCTNCKPLSISVRSASGVSSRANNDDSIVNFQFQPNTLTIALGDTVTWTNNSGGTQHTTTSDNALWDSGGLINGGTF